MKKIDLVISFILVTGLIFNFGITDAKAVTTTELEAQLNEIQAQLTELQGLLAEISLPQVLGEEITTVTSAAAERTIQSETQELQEGFERLPASIRADKMLNFADEKKNLKALQLKVDRLSSSRKAELDLKLKAVRSAIKSGPQTWIAGYNSIYILSDEEQKKLCGLKEPPSRQSNADTMNENETADLGVTAEELPSSFDWRYMHGGIDYITSVKNQGSCGSCWAFSAVGALEGEVNAYYNNPDLDLDLSEQQLVSSGGDCCGYDCGYGCGGGWSGDALDYIQDSKISPESCFPYEASDISCNLCPDWQANAWGITSWETTDDIKSALINKGPLSISMTVYSDFFSYKGGIYYSTSDTVSGGHAIVLVGYGNHEGRDYWILKNSWGSSWGESGYFRVFADDKSIEGRTARAINRSVPPTAQQVICTDNDEDGYCSWGLGPKPETCPSCDATIQDCNDSDETIFEGCTVVYPTYNLFVTKAGGGQELGTITSNPSGIDCGEICSSSFSGTVVLTAGPSSLFAGWSGACFGTGVCVVTMDTAKTVTATFNAAQALTVIKSGSGSGRVTSNPSGIDCGDTCVHPFSSNASVTLVATAMSGSTFAGWNGDCSDTGGACAVRRMDTAKTVTAEFNPSTSTMTGVLESFSILTDLDCEIGYPASMGYKFTPRKNGEITHLCGYFDGTETVKLYDSSYTVLASTSVTTVNSWACAPITPVSVTSYSVYYVIVELSGSGGCYQATILPWYSAEVSINASVVQSPSGTFNASHYESKTAIYGIADVVFNPSTITYTLAVNKSGSGSGTVYSYPLGINCGTTCSYSFSEGMYVTLDPVSATGSTFIGWSGACTGMGTCTIGMNSNLSVTATFNKEIVEGCTRYNGYIYCRGFKSTDSRGSSCSAACSERGYICPDGDNMFRSLSQVAEVAVKLDLLSPRESYRSIRSSYFGSPFIGTRLADGVRYIYYDPGWNQKCTFAPRSSSRYEFIKICRCEGAISPFITVVSPNGGEEWIEKKTYKVMWNQVGLDQVKINIELSAYKQDGTPIGMLYVIATNISAGQEYYNWAIPAEISEQFGLPPDKYKVRLANYKGGIAVDGEVIDGDESDGYFIILEHPASCIYLSEGVQSHYMAACGDANYDPVFDLNKDGIIDISDFGLISVNIDNEDWCNEMKESTENPCETCTDSDGGKDYYTKGTVTYGDRVNTDTCSASGYLFEQYCLNNSPCQATYWCPYGCQDGACISPTAYNLTVNSTPITGIPIASDPADFMGTTNYVRKDILSGINISLTAPLTVGDHTFSSWTGCDSVSTTDSRTCNLTMTSDKSVTATFNKGAVEGCTTYNSYIYCRGFKSTDPQGSSCRAACAARGYTCPVGDNMFRSRSQIAEVAVKLDLLTPRESYRSIKSSYFGSPYIGTRLADGTKYIYYDPDWNQRCTYAPRSSSRYEFIKICRCEKVVASQNLENIENQLASVSNALSELLEQVRDFLTE